MPFPPSSGDQDRTPRAARPTDEASDEARGSFCFQATNQPPPPPRHHPPHRSQDRDHSHRTTRTDTGGRPANAGGRRRVRSRVAHRRRQQVLHRRPQAQACGGDRGRRYAPRARRHPRDPGRQRLGQVNAHPAHQRTADPGQRAGRGLRPRHRTRRDGGQAPDQPGQRGRRLLQEVEPDGEPALRRPAVRPGRRDRQARRAGDPGADWASAPSGSDDPWSR